MLWLPRICMLTAKVLGAGSAATPVAGAHSFLAGSSSGMVLDAALWHTFLSK